MDIRIQIQRCGGWYKARYAGHANFVLSDSPQAARERLLNTPSKLVNNNNRNGKVRAKNAVEGFRLGKFS